MIAKIKRLLGATILSAITIGVCGCASSFKFDMQPVYSSHIKVTDEREYRLWCRYYLGLNDFSEFEFEPSKLELLKGKLLEAFPISDNQPLKVKVYRFSVCFWNGLSERLLRDIVEHYAPNLEPLRKAKEARKLNSAWGDIVGTFLKLDVNGLVFDVHDVQLTEIPYWAFDPFDDPKAAGDVKATINSAIEKAILTIRSNFKDSQY